MAQHEYNDYSYLWPPRPEVKSPRDMLPFYEQRGWWAQKKKNGTNNIVFTNGDQVIFKNRHGPGVDGDHKQWKPLPEHIEYFKSRAKNGKWHVFCSELLHHKTTHLKNHVYLFDVIVVDGVHLVGKTFAERQKLLMEGQVGEQLDDCLKVSEYISIAKNYTEGFVEIFDTLRNEDEGVVIKDPKAKLAPCYKQMNNTSWQVKSRKKHKNYSY